MGLDSEPLENIADGVILSDLLPRCQKAMTAAEVHLQSASQAVSAQIVSEGRVSSSALDQHQYAGHALAWTATYVESLRQSLAWAKKLEADGTFGEMEQLLLQIGFGEYLAQLAESIPMSQGELARPRDMGTDATALTNDATCRDLIEQGNSSKARTRLVDLMVDQLANATFGATGLDEEMEMVREQFRRFSDDKVVPHAHEWHLKDELIPLEIIEEMSELGVFGLTIPEDHGGFGMGKTAMCVVSEELSRGYIGVGSLGTRSEIAAELILCGGTEEQKAEWLPRLASGEVLPTAVFTEPNTGSDLGALKTKATKDGDEWVLNGNKTWITHGARTDIMTVLARTIPGTTDYSGLSMFIAPKTRGTDENPFPDATISGGEIEVLGYRGMKEFTLALDDHRVPETALLGGEEGQGFKQLMQTFESARIQTAARAIGVAQNALEVALRYALDRQAFGKSILSFPRVASKLATMAVEIMMARQLTYFAAREKDADRRCDLEAGMAKLLGARVAWSAADNGLQIHGGNGFALEYPISRILCDARILNIFEGAAEIQAQVIARRLLQAGKN